MSSESDIFERARGLVGSQDHEGLYELYASIGCRCVKGRFEERYHDSLVHIANNLKHGSFENFNDMYRYAERDELVEEIRRIHDSF